MTDRRFVATLRVVFDAIDELEGRIVAHELQEAIANKLDDTERVDVTQVIPIESLTTHIEPTELVERMYHLRDMLIKTRITQCFDLAGYIDKVAWILEHRQEATFDLAGYDYGRVMDRAKELLPERNR